MYGLKSNSNNLMKGKSINKIAYLFAAGSME